MVWQLPGCSCWPYPASRSALLARGTLSAQPVQPQKGERAVIGERQGAKINLVIGGEG